MKLVFATQNRHKLQEVQSMLGDNFDLIDLSQLNFFDDIPETKDTIEGNAAQKSWFVYSKFGLSCFADDTGLEVEALDGAPGVYSARYAGPGKSSQDNLQKLLREMAGVSNRKARFKTVMALILNGTEYLFEGIVDGKIILESRGAGGFGYDPVFIPDGYLQTFSEMPTDLKNSISHRARAMAALSSFLKSVANEPTTL
ncbi:MAG TPA: non-canonical purine NTP diphosphatase [Williamwhitmania sp.]|nr:non-canonical purine NTP diphosphatase [Williamwhitmania sp.]